MSWKDILFGENSSHHNGSVFGRSSRRSSHGYNDDYERGNREVWNNPWDHEAWNDHEDSCEHDDPWDCDSDDDF